MSLFVESTIKVSLIVLFALAAATLLRNRSAAMRHWMLSVAIACAGVAPLLQFVVPSWSVQVVLPTGIQRAAQPQNAVAETPAQDPASSGTAAEAQSANRRVFPWDPALAGLTWMLGTLASLSLMAIGLGRLAWLASRAEVADRGWADLAAEISRTLELCRPVELLQSDHPTLLVTWGFRRPKVILPASARTWSADRRRVVLLHELAHVRRGDWLTQMTAECLRAAYWFNPLVWLASRRLRQESEHACDDAVLSGGVEGSEYATHLLELARSVARERRPWFSGYPAPAMARPSSLERRFSAMLNGHLNRHPMTRPARLTTTIAVAVLTVLIAGLGAAQTFSTFSGTVFDSTNRVIPKVTLTLINAQSQAKYSIQSDPTGRFEFVGLPRGEYQFEVTGMGFTTLKGTVMVAGGNVQRNLALEIGSLQETITVAASPAAPSPDRTYLNVATRGSHDPGPCTVAATGGNIRPPRKVRDVRPLYPDHLRIAATGGVVTLEARIGGDGYVSEARVASSTHPDLDAAAVEAVQGWEFTSTLLNCDPVEVNMKVTVNFVIRP